MHPKKYLDQLFISKVRIKAIKYFVTHPDESIHLRGAVRELNEEINAVRRELTRLESIKMLTSERKANRKYFTMNTDFAYFEELRAMVFKSFGLGAEIVKDAKKLGEVRFAVLTSQFIEGENPEGLDLILVGDGIDMQLIDSIVTKEEKQIGRHINYTVLSERDFEQHKRRRDAFISQVLSSDRVMLLGRNRDFVGTSQ